MPEIANTMQYAFNTGANGERLEIKGYVGFLTVTNIDLK